MDRIIRHATGMKKRQPLQAVGTLYVHNSTLTSFLFKIYEQCKMGFSIEIDIE